MKPRIFVGSSSEGLDFAYALQSNLEKYAEITVWDQDIFGLSEFILESLLKALDRFDFGVFVFSPDDELRMRDETKLAARDNVIFELGLFVGRFGRSRSIFVMPTKAEMRIPSDLLGVNRAEFDAARQDKNWKASLGPTAQKIRKLLEDFETSSLPARSVLSDNDIRLLKSAIHPHYPSHTANYAFGNPPEMWDDKLCMRYIRLVELGLVGAIGPTEVQVSEKGRAFLAKHST